MTKMDVKPDVMRSLTAKVPERDWRTFRLEAIDRGTTVQAIVAPTLRRLAERIRRQRRAGAEKGR